MSAVPTQLRCDQTAPVELQYTRNHRLQPRFLAESQNPNPKAENFGPKRQASSPSRGKQLCLGKEKAAKYQTLEDTQSDDTPHKVFCAAIVVQIFQDFLTNVGKVVGVSEEGKSFQSDLFLTVKWGKFEPFF